MARTPDAAGKTGSEKLARIVRTRREELGMSRQELADAAGIPYPTIAQIETAYRGVSPARLGVIARVLDLDPKELYDVLATGGTTGRAAAAPAWHPNPRFAALASAPTPPPEPGTETVVEQVVALLSSLPADDRVEALTRVQGRLLNDLVEQRLRGR